MCGEESTVGRSWAKSLAPTAPADAEVAPEASTRAATGEPDWPWFLTRLMQNDHAAFLRITGFITAVISRMGAFELRDSWADIAQEVLTTVVENVRRGMLRDPRAFVGYTQTITRRRVLHWLEQHGRAPAAQDLEQLESTLSAAVGHDPELCLDLERALEDLPASCRQVVEHTYLGGRTYDETAALLGLTRRQVKRLQSRGLALLRESLHQVSSRC